MLRSDVHAHDVSVVAGDEESSQTTRWIGSANYWLEIQPWRPKIDQVEEIELWVRQLQTQQKNNE